MQLPFKELPIWMVANVFELSRWAERCPSVSPVLFYLYNVGVKNLLVSKYQTRWSVLSQGPNLSTLSADDAYTSWHLTSEWQSGVSFCRWGFNCSSVRTNIIKRWLLLPAVVIYIWLLWALRASAIRTEQAATMCSLNVHPMWDLPSQWVEMNQRHHQLIHGNNENDLMPCHYAQLDKDFCVRITKSHTAIFTWMCWFV